jgi:riboflavin kinase/FMN adenylyltransferase
MLTFRDLQEVPADFGPSLVAIGNFDGVHRGHCLVLRNLIARARERGLRSVAITFDPHPVRVLRPQQPLRLITPLQQKLRLLEQTGQQAGGLDAVLVLPFTQTLARMSAQEFAQTVLRDQLRAVEVHEGENFRFGHDAAADVQTLSTLGATMNFTVQTYPALSWRGEPVSSSRIRTLIEQGNVRIARTLLQRPFAVESVTARGRGDGTRHTVPTINLAPYNELLPANGVYITCVEIAGKHFEAVTNVGNRPTFGPDSFSVESHLLRGAPQELKASTPVTLHFLDSLREERRWPSPEALKQQIARDVARARHYFGLLHTLRAEPEMR